VALVTTAVVAAMLSEHGGDSRQQRVPMLLDDCSRRIQQIEADLSQLSA